MNEITVLKEFLNFPTGSTEEVFAQFKTIEGHVFRESDRVGKERFLYVEGSRKNKVFPDYADVMEPMRDVIEKGYDTDSNVALLGLCSAQNRKYPKNM